jgi:hypothetical protein
MKSRIKTHLGACVPLLLFAAAHAQPVPRPPAATALDAPPAMPAADAAEPADLPPARVTSAETRIEQRRQGNRIVELTVTPAGSTRSYVIVNREGQRPLSVQELSAGLSTPRFFKLEF